MARVGVAKTYKLFIGGAFPRSESGRTVATNNAEGAFMANVALASRKDLREAVVAARKGFQSWSGATPYNRGQVIYRMAEMLEARVEEFAGLIRERQASSQTAATEEVHAAIDQLVYYAGWTDKLASVLGHANAVSGPYFCYSTPEPSGVVGILMPPAGSLLALVGRIAPVLAAGNSAVVITSTNDACVAISLAEVAATSDVPAGTLNLLTGEASELGPHLAAHRDVNALDLSGTEPQLQAALEKVAAETIKRVITADADPTEPSLARIRATVEIKTIWHPVGAVALGGGGGY